MDLILTSISGAKEGASVAVSEGERASFGRTKSSRHVFEADRTMSAIHFEIEIKQGVPCLHDNRSANGTWLNGKRVSKESLKNGDRIRAGITTFEVQFKGTAARVDKEQDLHRNIVPQTLDSIPTGASSASLSPICDSSLVASPRTDEMDLNQEQVPEFEFLRKKLTVGADAGLPIVADGLIREWSVQVVMHPLKIRHWMPDNGFEPLWKGDLAKHGPITMPWNKFKADHFGSLARLIAADAIVIFVGWDLEGVCQRLRELSSMELSGFSESNGLLPCFWPSSLTTILDVRGAQVCKYLFGKKIAGALFTSPWDDQTVVGVGISQLAISLEKFNFESTDRLYSNRP